MTRAKGLHIGIDQVEPLDWVAIKANYDFAVVVGSIGKERRHQKMAEIVDMAHLSKMPLFDMHVLDLNPYNEGGGLNADKWPVWEEDPQFIMMSNAMKSKTLAGLILGTFGNTPAPYWAAQATRIYADRTRHWLSQTRGNMFKLGFYSNLNWHNQTKVFEGGTTIFYMDWATTPPPIEFAAVARWGTPPPLGTSFPEMMRHTEFLQTAQSADGKTGEWLYWQDRAALFDWLDYDDTDPGTGPDPEDPPLPEDETFEQRMDRSITAFAQAWLK